MIVDYSIPALLFPAITLLLLAYTNRFLAIATLIRNLSQKIEAQGNSDSLHDQIKNLNKRLHLIKNMQFFGILSFFTSVSTMVMIHLEYTLAANYSFGLSLFLLLISLGLSLFETQVSTKALSLELKRIGKGI